MTAEDLKGKLINRIQEVDDPEIIDHLLRLLEIELDLKSEKVYILTPEEEAAIAEAELDILNGNLISEEEAEKLTNDLLS